MRDTFREENEEYDHLARVKYNVQLYLPPELEQTLQEAGFSEINIYQLYDQSEVEFKKGRLIAVAD